MVWASRRFRPDQGHSWCGRKSRLIQTLAPSVREIDMPREALRKSRAGSIKAAVLTILRRIYILSVPRTSSTSCDQAILVDYSAKPICPFES